MMNGDEVFVLDLDAHLQSKIVLIVNVPGAGVANDIAVGGLKEQGAIPKGLRQRSKPQRGEKSFAVADHPQIVDLAIFQKLGKVISLRSIFRSDKGIDISPFLRPHVS